MNDLQKEILKVFKEVKKICDKHNLRYYAIGGTCIGAARHKGFIPWDDDLDIAMPYKDYLKFYEIAKRELSEQYDVYMLQERKSTYYTFMKVHDKSTTFIEKTEFGYPDAYKGVFVDIMPMNGVPGNESLKNKHVQKLRNYLRLNSYRRMYAFENKVQHNPVKVLYAKLVHVLGPYDYWSKKWEKAILQYDFDESENTGYTWSPNFSQKLVFSKEWFQESVDLPFEDTTIRCPVGYDKMLTKQFGDYMTPPPKEKQIGHHFAVIDFENSYEKYNNFSYEELTNKMNEQEGV